MIIHKLRWYRGFFSSLDYEFFLLGSDKVIKRIIFDLDRTLIPWLDEWDAMVEKTYNYFNIPFDYIPVHIPGTGDIFSALLVGSVLKGRDLQVSTAYAMKTLRELIMLNKDNADKTSGLPIELYLEELTNF